MTTNTEIKAWLHEDDAARVISAVQKEQALRDGGASATSVKPYSIALSAVSRSEGGEPAPVGEPEEWVAQVVSSGEYDFPLLQWRSADVSLSMPIGAKLYASPLPQEGKALTDEGEVVVTKNAAGQIVAVTRQDSEGRILKVIAQSATLKESSEAQGDQQ